MKNFNHKTMSRSTLLNRIALLAASLGLIATVGCDEGYGDLYSDLGYSDSGYVDSGYVDSGYDDYGGYGAGPIDHDAFIEYIRS